MKLHKFTRDFTKPLTFHNLPGTVRLKKDSFCFPQYKRYQYPSLLWVGITNNFWLSTYLVLTTTSNKNLPRTNLANCSPTFGYQQKLFHWPKSKVEPVASCRSRAACYHPRPRWRIGTWPLEYRGQLRNKRTSVRRISSHGPAAPSVIEW